MFKMQRKSPTGKMSSANSKHREKRKKEKECYHTHLRSYFPIKWKNDKFCSSVLPLWICQRDVINTIGNSLGFNTLYKRICYWHRRSRQPSFRIKMLTSARKSTPHPGRASTGFESNQVVWTKLPVWDQCNAQCYRALAPAWWSVWQDHTISVQLQTSPNAGLLHCSLKILYTLATF